MAGLGISTLMVEGGASLARGFLERDWWMSLALFVSDARVGPDGMPSPLTLDTVPAEFEPVRMLHSGTGPAASFCTAPRLIIMFTGIITDIGRVKAVETLPAGKRFTVATAYDTETIAIGASIAHDGVCLTVVDKDKGTYAVEAWEEALRLTTAGRMGSRFKAQSGTGAEDRRRAGRPYRCGPRGRHGAHRVHQDRGRRHALHPARARRSGAVHCPERIGRTRMAFR